MKLEMVDCHRRVVGWRSRIVHNGGYHKVEAQISIAANRAHVTKTGFYRETETRVEPWTVFVPVYLGHDLEKAHEAAQMIEKLFREGGTLTE